MHYYQHHIGDFIRDTATLNDAQAMTYLRLIWLYYQAEEPLPDDLDVLAFKIGCDKDTLRKLLKCYFYADGLHWHHKRIDKELERYKSKSEQAKNSAKARWANASDMRTHSDGNAKPRTNNQQPVTKKRPSSNPSVESALQTQPDKDKQIRIDVFNYWQQVTGHKQSKFNDKLEKLLKDRLKEGFTPDDLKSAIRGMWKTPHNRGVNDRNTVYDGLDLVCRDGANVNRFMNSDGTMPEFAPRIEGLSDAGNYTKNELDAWLNEGAERTFDQATVVEESGQVYEGAFVEVIDQGKAESPFSMFDEFAEN